MRREYVVADIDEQAGAKFYADHDAGWHRYQVSVPEKAEGASDIGLAAVTIAGRSLWD